MRETPAIITALRSATAAVHRELEALTLGDRIMDGSLTSAEYLTIITWQRAAHLAIEPELVGFSAEDYRYQSRGKALDFVTPPPSKTDLATAIGRAYVVEGSSLGGSMIYRKLRVNASLNQHAPFPFYQHQAEIGLQQWRSFVAYLAGTNFSGAEIEKATASAVGAFEIFRDSWG